MPPCRHIHIETADESLRAALSRRLKREQDLVRRVVDADPLVPGDVVVMFAPESTPFHCLELHNQALFPIVLAPTWSASDRERYLASGAVDYLLLEVPPANLVAAIRTALMTS